MAPANPNSYVLIGTIGFCIYFAFLCVVLWRVYVTFSSDARISLNKKMFHIALLASATFELLYYTVMWITTSLNTACYSLHIVGQYFNSVAFLCVVLFWSESISFGGQYEVLKKLALFIIGFNGCICFLSIILFSAYGLDSRIAVGADAILALDFCATLTLFATWMLVYGIRLQLRLSNYQLARTFDFTSKLSELVRINAVILACCTCYFFRALCLVWVFLIDSGDSTAIQVNVTELSWYSSSLWAPMLLSGCLLLYIMRMRRMRVGQGSHGSKKATDGSKDHHGHATVANNKINEGRASGADDGMFWDEELDESENFATLSEALRSTTVENPIKQRYTDSFVRDASGFRFNGKAGGAGPGGVAASNQTSAVPVVPAGPAAGGRSVSTAGASGVSLKSVAGGMRPLVLDPQQRDSSFIELRADSTKGTRFTAGSADYW